MSLYGIWENNLSYDRFKQQCIHSIAAYAFTRVYHCMLLLFGSWKIAPGFPRVQCEKRVRSLQFRVLQRTRGFGESTKNARDACQ